MPRTKTTVIKEEVVPTKDDENSPGAKIAVLRNEVRHVNETLNRVELKLDNMAVNFVTSSQLAAAQTLADLKHEQYDKKIASLEGWNAWATRIVLGLVLTSVVGLVVLKNTALI